MFFCYYYIEYNNINIEAQATVFDIGKSFNIIVFNILVNIGDGKVPDGTATTFFVSDD